MARYKFWDKAETLYTPGVVNGKGSYTAAEAIATFMPWAENPLAKVIISNAVINGGVMMSFDTVKANALRDIAKREETADPVWAAYAQRNSYEPGTVGSVNDDTMLTIIEWLEENPPAGPDASEDLIAATEPFRDIAAATMLQTMMLMPDPPAPTTQVATFSTRTMAPGTMNANTDEFEDGTSPMYIKVKKYYDQGLWPATALTVAVKKQWITPAEYTMVTSIPYTE